MTEKRYVVKDKWIEDSCIGRLLNIDFNTITDVNLCCDLLNRIEKEKRDYVKLASKLLEENDVLKQQLKTKYIVNKQYEELQRLKQENNELKQEIETLHEQLAHIDGGMFE